MKIQNSFVRILAALFVCAATQLSAEAALPTIEPVAGFGPSRSGDRTFALKINSNGDIAGYLEFPDESTREGFVRPRKGTHLTIMHPNEIRTTTTASEINDSGLIAGDYNASFGRAGFFLSGDTYTDVVIPRARDTYIYSLNNAGDFTGSADFQSPPNYFQPYVSIGGNVTFFSIPGASFTAAWDINNLNQVVGYYVVQGTAHGYIRDADGTLTFPIDYPGAIQTNLFGINDQGWMVGSYMDTGGHTHGLFLDPSTGFVVFDFPDARFTEFNGINNRGVICGRYNKVFGTDFGLVARVVLPTAE